MTLLKVKTTAEATPSTTYAYYDVISDSSYGITREPSIYSDLTTEQVKSTQNYKVIIKKKKKHAYSNI